DVVIGGEAHAEPGAGHLLDAVGFRPGGLLQLQAAELDVQLVALALQAAQGDVGLAVLVPGPDHAEGAGQHRHHQHDRGQDAQVHGRASASFSATRSTALRARGLLATSSSLARWAPPISSRSGTKACCTGIRRLPAGARAWRAMKCLTMRSSSEWKLITASRPPGRRRDRAASRPRSRSSSSRLTWMRMAWKARVAG